MPQDGNKDVVRRVVLPSGRVIEVIHFENLVDAASRKPLPKQRFKRRNPTELHICPACARELVYPVEWSTKGDDHWEALLRCPDCEWNDVLVFNNAAGKRFDDVLDRGTACFMRDLKRLTQANMMDEIERFVAALGADAILPEDF